MPEAESKTVPTLTSKELESACERGKNAGALLGIGLGAHGTEYVLNKIAPDSLDQVHKILHRLGNIEDDGISGNIVARLSMMGILMVGGAIVAMPIAEIYAHIRKGVIDGLTKRKK